MNLNTANLMVGKAASTDLTRYNLNSIHVTDSYTEATNGHILARVSLPFQFPIDDIPEVIKTEDAEYIEPFIMPAKAAMLIKTFKAKKHGGYPCLNDALYIDVEKTNMNGTVKFMTTDLDSTLTPELSKIKEEYPPCDRVIPKVNPVNDKAFHAVFDISYLETLLAIAKSTGAEEVCIDSGNTYVSEAVLLTAEYADQKFTGVIMPINRR